MQSPCVIFGIVVVAVFLFAVDFCQATTFTYEDTAQWPSQFPQHCSGQKQSPIDLKSSEVHYQASYLDDPFSFTNFDQMTQVSWMIKNTGHSAQVSYGGSMALSMTGGSLGGSFQVAQFHFHWGSDNTRGSEHTVDGAQYPMEMHIVTYNTKYDNLSEALGHEDGLAVLGFFFEISETDNGHFANIVTALANVTSHEVEASVTPVALDNLMTHTADYYRYSGGLTTPNCTEVVTWTVFKDTIKISNTQMAAFRALQDSHGNDIVDNFRPVQNLNGRSINSSFKISAEPVHSWSYEDVHDWSSLYPGHCDGQKQSPIDLVSSVVWYDPSYVNDPFTFSNFNHTAGVNWTLHNNGHSVQVNYGGDTALQMTGASLVCSFQVAQFHFHWGSDNTRGSEHTVDGAQYPMEMHIVTYNTRYENLSEAASHANGLAVLGFFVEVSDTDNAHMANIVTSLSEVTASGTETAISPVALDNLMSSTGDYYRYSGGLTTPKCNEVVIWTVFKDTIKISKTQMQAFRALRDVHNHTLVNNYRPVQPLNTRIIKTSFKMHTAPSTVAARDTSSLWTLASLLLLALGLLK